MTVRNRVGGRVVVRLTLEHSYAVVQLGDHSKFLVCCGIVRAHKRAVVGANIGNVGIPSVAELWIIVTSLCIRGDS